MPWDGEIRRKDFDIHNVICYTIRTMGKEIKQSAPIPGAERWPGQGRRNQGREKMTDQERDLYNELAFLFHHGLIQPKEYPALEKLAIELQEKEAA